MYFCELNVVTSHITITVATLKPHFTTKTCVCFFKAVLYPHEQYVNVSTK